MSSAFFGIYGSGCNETVGMYFPSSFRRLESMWEDWEMSTNHMSLELLRSPIEALIKLSKS